MRWVVVSVVVVGLAVVVTSWAEPGPGDRAAFDGFLTEFEGRTRQFMSGDETAWLAGASREADASIMGAWGAQEVGWSEVEARYHWAAKQFRRHDATLRIEYLSRVVGRDLAVTVAKEYATVWLANSPAPAPMTLRVTHVFRKEGGTWRLVHRHADPLVAKTAQAAVLQPEAREPCGAARRSRPRKPNGVAERPGTLRGEGGFDSRELHVVSGGAEAQNECHVE